MKAQPARVTYASVLQAALTRERRTNRRLRTVIDQLTVELGLHRKELEFQFIRIAQIQATLDRLSGGAGGSVTIQESGRRLGGDRRQFPRGGRRASDSLPAFPSRSKSGS